MFSDEKFVFFKKKYMIFFILFAMVGGFYNKMAFADNFAKCHSIIEINGLASDDYINSKQQTFSISYSTTGTTDTVSSLNNTYKNFIQTPNDISSNNNFLFLILKKKDVTNDLTCGFSEDDEMIICNSSQLWGSGCVKEYEEQVNINGTVTTQKTTISTCDLFDKQNNKMANSACYPQNHICNTYKNNISNKYFSVKGSKMPDASGGDGVFYVYTKNVVGDTKGSKEKTCDFEILPCDLKVKNETSTNDFVNVVFRDTSNKYNKKFIENISSGFNESNMFFKYVGTINTTSANYDDIMKAPYYYKYVGANSGNNITENTTIHYYKKYLTGGTNPKGRICSGYLPNCIYVDPNEESNLALYDRVNRNNENGNEKNRNTFYNSNVSGISSSVREEYLWFANNSYSASQVCLSRTGTSSNVNHDIGYCSDLKDDFSGLKNLKGLEYNSDGTPKCYLKSCIDLTVEELEKIKIEDPNGNYKWCSEYYYLESSGGLKYFSKEKPKYCSDLDSNGYLEHRATWEEDEGKYRYCLEDENNQAVVSACKSKISGGCDNLTENSDSNLIKQCSDCSCRVFAYYSYGGGRNSSKSNCYLKNCFSLNDKERQVVADANVTNIGFEMERNSADLSKFSRSNLPKYCDNGFLFNKDMDEFKDFNYLNLNVISCADFSKEHLNNIVASRMILFTDLLGEYNTELSKVFCRTHYKPLNKKELVDEAKTHNESTNFLETTYIIADENETVSNNTAYKDLLKAKYGVSGYDVGLNIDPFINIPERAKTDYKKIKISNLKDVGVNKYLFSNICSYVDNAFLYYNADIWDLRYDVINSDSNVKIAEVINNIQTKNDIAKKYLNCLNENCDESGNCKSKAYNLSDNATEQVPDKCRECNKNTDPLKRDKCLVDLGDDCKNYAYDYFCKKEAECIDEKGNIKNNICFLKDNISDYIINCEQYVSTYSVTSIFDCSLFGNNHNSYKNIYENYLIYGEKGFIEDDLEGIKKSCNDNLPLIDTRNLPEADPDSALLKPFKLDVYNFNNSASDTVGKNDIERYGCAVYNKPTNVTDVLSSSLWGCKTPNVDSSYISKYTSDFIINNVSFKDNFKQPYLSEMLMSVCSRYPDDKYVDNQCGQRENSSYKDKCLELIVNNENISNSETLEDTTSGIWYFNNASGGTRFRYEKHGRDVIVFRDFYTYYMCNASNIDSKYYYYDEVSAGIITGEAVALGTIIGTISGASACILLFLIPGVGAGIYTACVAGVVTIAVATSITSMLLARAEEYNLSLQNNLYYPHEYFGNNDNYGEHGFLSKATITNNDDYIYRYYQRSDTIEEDLKNKLESNINWDDNNTRFFFGNTLSKDIIRKCNIQNLFGLIGNCVGATYDGNVGDNEEQITNNQTIHCDYKYNFFELEDDGSRKQENGINKVCNVTNNESAEKCLTEKQRKCLAGYGVKFLFNDNIDNEFLTSNGSFLKTYRDGDSVKQSWGTEEADNYNWVPVNIVPYTMDISSKDVLKDRSACKLMKYGDSFGSLDKCRGFEHDGIFYTESQSVKPPLFTSPVFFYTLITPRNIPELFNPVIMLEYYYLFSKYQNGEINNLNKNKYEGLGNKLILDFYNPKVQYYYDFANGTGNESYNNKYTIDNQFIVEIKPNERTGKAHVLRYISDIFINEMSYGFTIDKTFSKTLYSSYTPQVCLYQIKAISNNEAGLNSKIETSYCNKDDCKYKSYTINEDTGINDIVSCCLEKTTDQSFIIIDNNVDCYERAMPFLSDFAFMQSKNMDYNNPVINAYLKPSYKQIDEVVADKDSYILKDGDSEDILLIGENSVQSFGLNFERSYCSKAYYDYYKNLDLLERELNSENRDQSKVTLYRKNLSTIESVVIPDCNKENGNEIELLINENNIKTYNDVDGVIDNIIAKETVKVKSNNALYGGFSEVCLAENDIKHILSTYNKQHSTNITLPNVLAYKFGDSAEQRKTKCILDVGSMKNEQCIIADKVYVYCTDEEINFSNKCIKKLDITNNKEVYVREVDCLSIKNSINTTSSLDFIKRYVDNGGSIKDIQACYKGGFNMLNTIYKNDLTQEYSCSCVIVGDNSDYSNFKDFVDTRLITSREYGLCVDLIKPNICPAVRYFDSKSQYVDDRLALGKTEEELESMDIKTYEQHLWRTNEKQLGIMPSVFYESDLGHAEFPASVYCGVDKTRYTKDGNGYKEDVGGEYIEDKNGNKVKAEEYYKNNCIGGKIQVEGECNGYWKEKIKSVPLAVCTSRTNKTTGTTIYEYKLLGYGCERYFCPAIGYNPNTNNQNLDERVIEYNDSQLFKENEINTFLSGIELTDFSSFKHNEELGVSSVDIRGAYNGFAIWGDKDNIDGTRNVISDDYARVIRSESCLTGFAPAGTNYRLLTEFNNKTINDYNDYNIYYQNSSSHKNNTNTYGDFKISSKYKNSLVQIYKDKKYDYDNLIDSTKTPHRRCNQLGEWMTVEDPYNNALISSVYSENFYYNSSSSSDFWKSVYKNPANLPDVLSNANYCERLVCPEISSGGNNYFKTEFVYGDDKANSSSDIMGNKKQYYMFWKHSGGAFWDMIGTPRNSSNIIADSTVGVGYGDSSRSVDNIFSAVVANDSTVNNKYKYVKKVYGRCENEYGYYNRGSEFNNKDFSSQYNVLTALLASSMDGAGEVDPRKESMLNSLIETTKPSRHCTSTGLWSGVLDPCFRACEMMDIYHTTFNERVYSGNGSTKANIVGGSEYFVENSDIKSIDLGVNDLQLGRKWERFENRFVTLHSPNDLGEYNSFKTGDYLTGGAKWPRSIVTITNNNVDYKLETSGSKAGLRYIEVEADCDSTFDTGDNRIRQFVLRSTDKKPKRRCYEDGTWGPVYGDTRCILAKNCIDYSFTLFNLTNLMAMYNRNVSAVEINNYIANIPYGVNGVFNSSANNNNMKTAIYNFSANNTVADGSKSYNVIKTSDNSKFLTTIDDNSDLSRCDTTINSNCISSSICTITESNDATNVAGWSLNLRDNSGNTDINIGRYFKPTTCVLNNSEDNFYVGDTPLVDNVAVLTNISYLNRIQLVYTPSGDYKNKPHYSKNSLLNESYDLLNGGINPSNCDSRYSDSEYNKTEIKNESCKGVNIGKEYYNSYQIHYECKDEYYNKLSGDTGNYYNKHIIFECKTDNASSGRFYYHEQTKDNSSGTEEIIRASNCEPITCGNNKYQNGWSSAIIYELKDNTANVSGDYKSSLTCPAGKAFVFKNKPNVDTTNGGWVEYYKDSSGVDYSQYNFVSKIHGTCSRIKNDAGVINGSSIDEKSYDYRRYGEIHLGQLLKTPLCTDIYKQNCNLITNEAEIFAKGKEFIEKYCVPMVCPYTNLKFVDDGDLDGNDAIIEDSGGFSLPGTDIDRYEFGTNVVIQSMDGDYKNSRTKEYCESVYSVEVDGGNDNCEDNVNDEKYGEFTKIIDMWGIDAVLNKNKKCVYIVKKTQNTDECVYSDNSKKDSSIVIDSNNIFYNYGVIGSDTTKQITGNICHSGADIYSDGGSVVYTLYNYLDTIDDVYTRTDVLSCFSMLNNNDVVVYSNSCQSGYTSINNKICVKYSNNYLETNKYLLSDLTNEITNFKANDTHKTKAADFIVDTIMFNGININKVSDYISNTYTNMFIKTNNKWVENNTKINETLTTEAVNLLNESKTLAINNTDNYINTSGNFSYKTCVYDDVVTDDLKSVVYNNSEYSNNNILMQKYKDITGISVGFYEFTNGAGDVIVGTLTSNIVATCNTSITKYVISSHTNGYYKINKKDTKCVLASSLNSENQIEIDDGVKYVKMNTADSCTTDSGEGGVIVEKLNSSGRCFYKSTGDLASSIDLSMAGAIIDCRSITNCTNIVNNQLNTGTNILNSDVTIGENNYNGEVWIDSDRGECASGYYFIKNTYDVNGKGFVSLEDYINKYNGEYKNIINSKKEELKTNIIGGTAGSNSNAKTAYKNLFDKWIEKYRTEEFLEDANNTNLYNVYLDVLEESSTTDSTINRGRIIDNEFYKICMGLSDDDNNMECKDIDYLNNDKICLSYNNNDICLNGLNGTNTVCINNNCKEIQFNAESATYFDDQKIYVTISKIGETFEYLDDIKNNIDGTGLIGVLNTKIDNCKSYYIDYYNKKNTFDKEQSANTAKFNNGLFMVMQCTPNGWKPLTNSSCKYRCGAEKFEGNFNPKNLGTFENVTMFISQMRHSVELKSIVAVHQESTSDKSRWANGEFDITCIDGNYKSFINKKTIENYNHFDVGWMSSNHMTAGRVYTVCENTYVSAYPQWNQIRARNDLTTSNLDRITINGKACKENIDGFAGEGKNTGANIGCYYCRGGFTQIGFTSYSHTDDAEYWNNSNQGVNYHKQSHKK